MQLTNLIGLSIFGTGEFARPAQILFFSSAEVVLDSLKRQGGQIISAGRPEGDTCGSANIH
ncbi:MAG: hypothetical protein WD065_03675, partial [Planctomycetaceae bacterium]